METAYGASKGGVKGMVLPMARDLSRFGIRVNGIAPGVHDTLMGRSIEPIAKQALLEAIPLGRFGKPSEFAHAVKFLIENTYMCGSVLNEDGGLRVPFT
jgi:NAD(P)-dependent dehydrogenase (short-subunit alcohol dehydrogenase family)